MRLARRDVLRGSISINYRHRTIIWNATQDSNHILWISLLAARASNIGILHKLQPTSQQECQPHEDRLDTHRHIWPLRILATGRQAVRVLWHIRIIRQRLTAVIHPALQRVRVVREFLGVREVSRRVDDVLLSLMRTPR